MTGAHQRKGGRDVLLAGAQLAPQQRMLALGDQSKMVACDVERELEAGRGGIQLSQLQLDALAHRARSYAGWIERLYPAEHCRHFLGRTLQFRSQRLRNLLEGLGDVA